MQVGVFVYAFSCVSFLLERVSRQIICTHSHVFATKSLKEYESEMGG